MFDDARAMETMINMLGVTQGELAQRLGVSQSYVANKLRLLSYSDECRGAITAAGLTERHARTILGLSGNADRLALIEKCRARRLTVRECEVEVDLMRCDSQKRALHTVPRAERINSFRKMLEECVKTLSEIGVDITRRTSYEGGKTYIMLCINEARKL